MKFDLTITNPPYNSIIDLKILYALKDNIEEIICVHPAIPFNDIREARKLIKNYKTSFNFKDIEFLDLNAIFGTCMFAQGVITHTDINYRDKKIDVDYFGEKYQTYDVYNVNKFSKNWETIIKPFYQKMLKNSKIDNLMNHFKCVDQLIYNRDEITVQLSLIRGNINEDLKKVEQLSLIRGNILQISGMRSGGPHSSDGFSPDFYTYLMKDSNKNIGIRNLDPRLNSLIEFETREELDNFIAYLKTDFARMCLAIYKTNGNILSKISSLVPWLDFKEKWDDKKLFDYFNIDQKTRDYITGFFPDYYNIKGSKDG